MVLQLKNNTTEENFERLKCSYCKKIIVEATTLSKLKIILAGQKYVQCPYCGQHLLNPMC